MKYNLQLCKLVTSLPKGEDWIYELKYDGYRILSVHGKLISRNGRDWTDKFKSIKPPTNMILDGEIIAENFSDIRKSKSLVYVVFDILELDGKDLRKLPLIERKQILARCHSERSRGISALPLGRPRPLDFARDDINIFQISDYITTFTQNDFDKICKNGFEGIIAKRKNSVYSGTRNGDWVKLKCRPHAITPQLTSPEKLLFENITKAQLADYYKAVAHKILPHLRGRIISLVKCPNGIHSDCFYNKNQNDEKITISNAEQLLHHVQMNTIEFHAENPDAMVFDLDPGVGMNLADVRQGVRDLKSVLDELKLQSFLKTSGGKGYHIYVPFKHNDLRNFSKNVAEVMQAKWPDRYTTNIRKINRSGKIFIDWLRNTRGATSVAPYSVRAKPGAPVSMPIEWSELDKIAPADIDIKKAIARLKKNDPWKF